MIGIIPIKIMENKMIIKTQLSEKEMPKNYYNISADLKEPLPPVF